MTQIQTALPTDAADVEDQYRRCRDRYANERAEVSRKRDRIADLRLLIFALVVAFTAGAIWLRAWPLGVVAGALFVIFLVAVIMHNRLSRAWRTLELLVRINDEAILRIDREWDKLPVRHTHQAAEDHPYSRDLDIFGKASLFHLLETVTTEMGEALLGDWLLSPAPMETIGRRQQAVQELASLPDFREELALRGRIAGEFRPDPEPFLQWAEGPRLLEGRTYVFWGARLSTVLLWIFIAAQVFGLVPYPVWLVFAAVNFALVRVIGGHAQKILSAIVPRERTFLQFASILEIIFGREFRSDELRRIQNELKTDGVPAHEQLRRLHRLTSFVIPASYMLYWPVQILTLWDVHLLYLIERWQSGAGARARAWLKIIGETEALAALATLSYDNPDWAFPEIQPDNQTLEARDLAHPLIRESVRVANDVEVGPLGTFLLVTGSNMSGKSTLLRSIGVNVTLAGAGGPVCASRFRMPPVRLWTSMRVQDSLEQGVSYFMAELQRLKQVVDAARAVRSDDEIIMLYLLDEILQGTNTRERQIAARLILMELLELGAIGAVSTHDLTLADTEEMIAAANAVHFTETISDDNAEPEMSFDYKLRPGIATSSNALALMRIVGLDLSGSEDQT